MKENFLRQGGSRGTQKRKSRARLYGWIVIIFWAPNELIQLLRWRKKKQKNKHMYLQMNPNQLLLNNLNFALQIKIIKAQSLCFAMNNLTLGIWHHLFLSSEMRTVNSTCPPVYVVMQINWDNIGSASESSGRLVKPHIAGLHPHRFWRFWFSRSGVGLKNLYS